MKKATVVPVGSLPWVKNDDYHMCLAHVMARSDDYAQFYKFQHLMGRHVIMDNGAVETGRALSMGALLEIHERYPVTEIILPDSINNRVETISLMLSSLHELKQWKNNTNAYDYMGNLVYPKIMAVPQGRNLDEWYSCLSTMIQKEEITAIGISKFTQGFSHFDRADLAMLVPEHLEVHFLGCTSPSDLTVAVALSGRLDRIRGIDSGVAAICANSDKKFESHAKRPETVELDFSDRNPPSNIPQFEDNLTEWDYHIKTINRIIRRE